MEQMLTTLLAVATLMLVVVTLLPLSRNQHWMIRGMDFPRLQFGVFAAVLLLLQCLFLDRGSATSWGLTATTIACLCWQVWRIAPYTRLWPVEVQGATDRDPDRRLKILTSNVLTSNRRAEELLALVEIHEPHVLVTLETDQWWQDRLDVLEARMPHTIKCPLDNLYGMHVYSRLPLAERQISFLVENDVPSMHALVELATGDLVRVHFLHPAPPSPTENVESAQRDAELVIVARATAGSDDPLVITGDLNDVAWSATTRLFRKLSGLLDPRVGRGLFNTFHAKYPFLRWPLDHLFHSRHFTVVSILRLPAIGSDHYPLLTELSFTPADGADQAGLTADDTDRSWARSIADGQDADHAAVPRPGN